jgi:hypothetical protein
MSKCRFVFTEPGGGWHSDKDTHAIKPGCMFDVVEDITAFELFRDYIALRRPVLVRLTKPPISTSKNISKEELAQRIAWSRSTIAKVHAGIQFSTHVVP